MPRAIEVSSLFGIGDLRLVFLLSVTHMIVLSPDRMKKYDEHAIKTWGIPAAVLMENAGRSTYRLLRKRYLRGHERILIFCGKGNNGGDGFVIARYAVRDGFNTEVLLLADPDSLQGDARLNMELYRSVGGKLIVAESAQGIDGKIETCDLMVDAIFGTGLAKEVVGTERGVIEAINRSGKPVVSVDIPSGLDGLRGIPLGVAVRATHTYTYGHPKLGHFLYPGATLRGELTVVDISLHPSAQDEIGVDAKLMHGEILRSFFRNRPREAHKGMFGHLAVIAGSAGKTGAAIMSTLAALKIGAGLVTVVVPASLNSIVAARLTEAMTFSVEDNGRGFLPLSAFNAVKEFVADKDLIIVGPGLGQAKETMALVRRLYAELDKPFVIDADGVNAFEGHPELLFGKEKRVVLTPHPGEFGRLIGRSPSEVNASRLDLGRAFAETYAVNLVLKGAPTITFSADGEAYVNPTGNPALSKGGTGDVLTGFIGGLIGQGYSIVEAAVFGVYLHGYIGDTWSARYTEMDLLARDLIAGLGAAIRDIRNGTDRVYVGKSL
jgi:hydroxyethylthiazole kinase-like uncharacterized protein yjeF